MWALLRAKVLINSIKHRHKTSDEFADFYCKQYDLCMKLGGDLMYGVFVLNGNIPAMRKVIKKAFDKGLSANHSNFIGLKELKPAFDAYWMGAEMAPLPNPLFKPGLWPSTPPAPGATTNIGPFPPAMILSMIKTAALIAAAKALVEALKKVEINLTINAPFIPKYIGEQPPPTKIKIKVYETAEKLLKGEPMNVQIVKHPVIKLAKEIILTFKDLKKRLPSIGSQFKIGLKFPFPKLPDRAKLIEQAKKALIKQAMKIVEEQMVKPVMDLVIQPIVAQIKAAVDLAENLPKKPTEAEIKQFVKDTINGVTPSIQLPNVTIPKIDPQKIKDDIKRRIPTKEQLEAMAYDMIKKLIPNIPYIRIPFPPLGLLSTSKSYIVDPFINMAKMDNLTRSGTHNIIAIYPGAPPVPGPASLMWNGYKVKDGPKFPDIPIPKLNFQIPAYASGLPTTLPTSLPSVPTPALPTMPGLPG